MKITIWLHTFADVAADAQRELATGLLKKDITTVSTEIGGPMGLGICLAVKATPELRDYLQWASKSFTCHILTVLTDPSPPEDNAGWDLLKAGASDVLFWTDISSITRQIQSRVKRWTSVEQLLEGVASEDLVVGKSRVWRSALRNIIEVAHFSDTAILILGESGTGKEVAARLIHHLDPRPNKRDLFVLDCSTIMPDLSGSEFFGHERGAFTGAVTDRQGAFALANGGTLFLDEVGELSPALQAQLLRVIQERTYKRLGGSAWLRSEFRVVCATNRDLLEMISRGAFRADLYYRLAGYVANLPPLRERLEDILPLVEYFAAKCSPNQKLPEIDPVVRNHLLRRDYPGNVRELQQTVHRLMYRCGGDGTITIGCIPPEERLNHALDWVDIHFERLIHRAVLFGAGLKEIGRAAEECAIRYATQAEDGSLQRAARRLGVTDRALQIRRANGRALPDQAAVPRH
jgi:transcriptional regulator with GAF, ATPase, and Fis domain